MIVFPFARMCVYLCFVVFVTVSPLAAVLFVHTFVYGQYFHRYSFCDQSFSASTARHVSFLLIVIRSVFSSNKCVLFLGLIESQLCNVKM